MSASLAPALVAAGSGLVDSVINAFSTSSANKRNIELAREQMAWQSAESEKARQASRDFALEMFDLENAYNTPLAQIERLREAGINPYAALSQGSSQVSGQASGNGSLPGLMPGGISTPHVSPIPSFVSGFLPALQAFAEIKLKDAQARKAGAETYAIDEKLQKEIDNLMADTKYKEAQASYTQLLRDIESVYGRSERGMKLKNMVAEYYLAVAKGETEKSQRLLYNAEKELTDTRNANEKQQAPVILDNLKKTGRAIDASAEASRARAEESRAGAAEKRSRVELNKEELSRLRDTHDDFVRIQSLVAGNHALDYNKSLATMDDYIIQMHNARLISDTEYERARSLSDMARKKNDYYHFDKVFNYVERLNNGVNKWAPWALSRDDSPSPGEGMMYQSWQQSSTR